jgi:hypothetical protein
LLLLQFVVAFVVDLQYWYCTLALHPTSLTVLLATVLLNHFVYVGSAVIVGTVGAELSAVYANVFTALVFPAASHAITFNVVVALKL